MSLIGYALLVISCSTGYGSCEAVGAVETKTYPTLQACEDARWAAVGQYQLEELVCAEVRR